MKARFVVRLVVASTLAIGGLGCSVTNIPRICGAGDMHCAGPFENIPVEHAGRIESAGKLALDVLWSGEFKNLMMSAKSKLSTDRKFGDDWSRFAIEDLQRAAANGFQIDTASVLHSAVAFRTYAWDGSDGPILLNRMKLGKQAAYGWAGTIVHELAHHVEYYHMGNKRSGNECSVPYVAGDVAEFVAYRSAGEHDERIFEKPCKEINELFLP